MMNQREKRIGIYMDTIAISNIGSYQTKKGTEVKIPVNIGKSELYDTEIKIDFHSLPNYNTQVKVINEDSFIAAEKLINEGLKCAVLNMASWVMPGGGALKGSSAQEESLFRRSNLFQSLYRFKTPLAKEYGLKPKEKQYPLDVNYGGVYSEAITVFKGTEANNCPLLEKPFQVDVVSVAAYKNPILENGELPKEVREITINKIKTILNICLINGNDSVVLGAFGCGAYHNPPREIAKLFKEVINSTDYKNKFKEIVFAIIDDKNSNGNFESFRRIFEV